MENIPASSILLDKCDYGHFNVIIADTAVFLGSGFRAAKKALCGNTEPFLPRNRVVQDPTTADLLIRLSE
jgi:hypothetical protein